MHVLVTVFWHTRSAAEMRERYDARIWAPKAARPRSPAAPGSSRIRSRSATSCPAASRRAAQARAAEVVYWIPEHSALVPGDVLIADGKGGAKLCPESWLPEKTTHRDLAASLRPLLDLPVRRILVSHGKPVVTGGGRALARARGLDSAMLWLWILLGRRSRSSSSSPPSATTASSACATRRTRAGPTSTSSSSAATDLIPNLVEAVRGYAAHERAVFEEVTKARAALQQASTPGAAGEANDVLTAALGRLFAVAEAYPDLKASENFLRLQEDLTDTEDKISAARRYYNSTVMHYNTAIQSIPWVLVARPLGFRAKEFFSAAGDTAVPQVSLAPAT